MFSLPDDGTLPLPRGSPAIEKKPLNERFFVRLLGLVRSRLFGEIRNERDVFVVDSVLNSFFAHHAPEKIDFENESSLWPVLSKIALRHCNKHNKRFQRAPEVRAIPIGPASPYESIGGFEPVDDEPSPDDMAEFLDFLTRLQERLSERERKVLELALNQEAQGDIARRLAVSQTTICNDLKRIRTLLEAELR